MAETVMTLGKYSGRTFGDIYQNEKSYCNWVVKIEPERGILLSFLTYVLGEAGAPHYSVLSEPSAAPTPNPSGDVAPAVQYARAEANEAKEANPRPPMSTRTCSSDASSAELQQMARELHRDALDQIMRTSLFKEDRQKTATTDPAVVACSDSFESSLGHRLDEIGRMPSNEQAAHYGQLTTALAGLGAYGCAVSAAVLLATAMVDRQTRSKRRRPEGLPDDEDVHPPLSKRA